MTIIEPKTRRIQHDAAGKKYSNLKYVCPDCGGIELRIQRGYRNMAKCQCASCGHKWNMKFYATNEKVMAETKAYWAKHGLNYRLTYDNSAPYEEQLPF